MSAEDVCEFHGQNSLRLLDVSVPQLHSPIREHMPESLEGIFDNLFELGVIGASWIPTHETL